MLLRFQEQKFQEPVLYLNPGAELERLTRLMLCFTSYTQHGGNALLVKQFIVCLSLASLSTCSSCCRDHATFISAWLERRDIIMFRLSAPVSECGVLTLLPSAGGGGVLAERHPGPPIHAGLCRALERAVLRLGHMVAPLDRALALPVSVLSKCSQSKASILPPSRHRIIPAEICLIIFKQVFELDEAMGTVCIYWCAHLDALSS